MVILSTTKLAHVLVKNAQRTVQLDTKLFRHHVGQLVSLFGVVNYDIAVLLVGESKISDINQKFSKGSKGPTDILSFPMHDDLIPGQLPLPTVSCEYNLGDIFICPKMIYQRFNKQTVQQQLPVYVTHGICHLLGYVHDDKESHTKMFIKERDILEQFNHINGYHCIPLTTLPSNL